MVNQRKAIINYQLTSTGQGNSGKAMIKEVFGE